MKAICENELVIDCAGYKAIDSGVILMGDEDRKEVVAYIPNEKLEYLLPDDVVEREYERLGLPAPVLASPEDLESRLEEFAGEIDDLREHLDRQVEELIDEGVSPDDEDFERQDRLRERRRTVDRLLQQVRQRAQQLRQLSTVEAETGTEPEDEGVTPTETERAVEEGSEGGGEPTDEVEALRAEMDERFDAIERQLEGLVAATEGSSTEPESAALEGDGEAADGGSPSDEGEAFVGIHGLGPTYRSRLHDAGIDTLEALVERSPEDIADVTQSSENRARAWIERANERLEEREQEPQTA